MTLAPTATTINDADLQWLVEQAACLLEVPAHSISPDTPLFEVGLDSVTAIELAAGLKGRLGLEVPETLLYESPTPREALARLKSASPEEACDRRKDARLPSEIAPPAGTFRPGPPRHVLLTGVTGFLGGFTLAELVARTEARVTCIVRGGSRSRVLESASARGIADPGERLSVLHGDLEEPRIGLDPLLWSKLAEEVDSIVHLAADVDWVSPYSRLKASSAGGTLELLRLACDERAKAFHFCSSISVLYPRGGPESLAEDASPLDHVEQLDLGYAAAKAVAEELVQEAGRRGLPVTVTRPSLITGHSRTGEGNPGDFLSMLIKGCTQLGVAPELDWDVDVVPVDHVARVIADCVSLGQDARHTLHLLSPRPRPFREVILWHALYGHPLQLAPYDRWLKLLEAAPSSNALAPLLPFLRSRPGGEGDCTLPEQYEEQRRTRALAAESARWLESRKHHCAEPSTHQLECWTRGLERAGYLEGPATRSLRRGTDEREAQRRFVESHLGGSAPEVERLQGSSILAELGAWQFGEASGLSRWRSSRGSAVLKARQTDRELHAVFSKVFALAGEDLGQSWIEYGLEAGLLGAHHREPRLLGDDRLKEHTPGLIGVLAEEAEGRHWILMEDLKDLELLDSADRPGDWTEHHLTAAVEGLARIHAAHIGCVGALESEPWIGTPPTPARQQRLAPLWRALADHAAADFQDWAGIDVCAMVDGFLEAAPVDTPKTLIHGDFNPRNMGFRRTEKGLRLVAYDWELATLDLPQRDLVELLAFVGPDDPGRWTEAHRVALERAAGIRLDPECWMAGAEHARRSLLLTRLTAYQVIHRVRRQSYLPRTVQNLVRQLESLRVT